MVGGISSSSVVLYRGIMSKADGSTAESLLRRLGKCSRHLSFTAFLFFSRAKPLDERRGETLDLVGTMIVVTVLKNIFIFRVSVYSSAVFPSHQLRCIIRSKDLVQLYTHLNMSCLDLDPRSFCKAI